MQSGLLTLVNNTLYLVGPHSNDKENPDIVQDPSIFSVEAERGENGIEENKIDTSTKNDDDLYLAAYDLDGNLKQFKSLKSQNAIGRIETVFDMLHYKGKLYVCGQSFCSNGEGSNPSYNNKEVKVGARDVFSFVFCFPLATLELEKIYTMRATDADDDITLSSLGIIKDRLYVVGSSNARSELKYNENESLSLGINYGQVLIYGEVDLLSNQIKNLKTLGKEGTWTMGYTIAGTSKGDIYLGGTAGENINFPLKEGVTSPNLNGAFLAKWNIEDAQPEKIYPIGTNSDENVLKEIIITENDIVLFSGYFEKTFNAIESVPIKEVGEGDSFLGTFNLKEEKIEKLYCFGSKKIDELKSLYLDKKTADLYFAGYYVGENFNLFGAKYVREGEKNYYIGRVNANATGAVITPDSLSPIEHTDKYLKLYANRILWEIEGEYKIYTMSGALYKTGQVEKGSSTTLSKGVYIVRINDKTIKIIIN